MGIVKCKKHGLNGIILTYEHISESVWNFKEISCFVKRVEKRKNENDKFDWDWIYVLCGTCDEEYKQTTIHKLPHYLLKPACAKCFIELSSLENWK